MNETYWIEYRYNGERVLFETDNKLRAEVELLNVIVNRSTADLIDYSYSLDGSLDNVLEGIKLFPADETAKVA